MIQPIGAVPALDTTDSFYRDLLDAGYVLFQAGAIPGRDGAIYSAYLFTRLKMGEQIGEDTFLVAFYYWDGKNGSLIGRFNPPAYSERNRFFPSYYRLANWDDTSLALMGLSDPMLPSQAVHVQLGLEGHATDLNQNGLPEFTFFGEYCPDNCLQTVGGVDVFEIGADDKVKILTAGLPGHLRLEPILNDPLTFEVDDVIWLGEGGAVVLPTFYRWDSGMWVEAPEAGTDVIQKMIEMDHERIRNADGLLTGRDGVEAALYGLLLLHEHLGQPQAGLDAFRMAVDLKQWPQANPLTACWLQLAEARASDEYASGRPFRLLPPLIDFSPNEDIPPIIQAISGVGYDLSACERWMP